MLNFAQKEGKRGGRAYLVCDWWMLVAGKGSGEDLGSGGGRQGRVQPTESNPGAGEVNGSGAPGACVVGAWGRAPGAECGTAGG